MNKNNEELMEDILKLLTNLFRVKITSGGQYSNPSVEVYLD